MKVKFVLLVVAVCGVCEIRAGLFGGLADAAKEVMGRGKDAIGRGTDALGHIEPLLPIPSLDQFSCDRDVTKDFTKATFDFAMRLYKRVAFYNKDHFLISPLSMWMSLAAIAEGTDGVYQRELFAALNLPEESCLREKYYQLALTREIPGDDVKFLRKRLMVLDQNQRVNDSWAEYIKLKSLLEVSFAPIRSDPVAVAMQLQQFLGARSFPPLAGNSVLVDSLDYEGLWTNAFPDARIESGPFYNDAGQNIGTVEYLKIKQKVKIAHLPLMNTKIIDLPVGQNGRYRMMIAVGLSDKGIRNAIELLVNTIVIEVLSLFKESVIPLEVAIPRFALNFEYEASGILDECGAGSLFKQPEATWLISNPPAQPSSFYQRVSVKIDSRGLLLPESSPVEGGGILGRMNPISAIGSVATDMATGFAEVIGRDFIANRPFMFGLFDSETNTCLFAGAYSQPDVLV